MRISWAIHAAADRGFFRGGSVLDVRTVDVDEDGQGMRDLANVAEDWLEVFLLVQGKVRIQVLCISHLGM